MVVESSSSRRGGGGGSGAAQRPSTAVPAAGSRKQERTKTKNGLPQRPQSAAAGAGNVFKYPQQSGSGGSGSGGATGGATGGAGAGRRSSASPVVTLRAARERDRWLEETWLRGRSLDAADERNQAEVTAAMQQVSEVSSFVIGYHKIFITVNLTFHITFFNGLFFLFFF